LRRAGGKHEARHRHPFDQPQPACTTKPRQHQHHQEASSQRDHRSRDASQRYHQPSGSRLGTTHWSWRGAPAGKTASDKPTIWQDQPHSPPRYNRPHRGGDHEQPTNRHWVRAKPNWRLAVPEVPPRKPKPRARCHPQTQQASRPVRTKRPASQDQRNDPAAKDDGHQGHQSRRELSVCCARQPHHQSSAEPRRNASRH